jgi:hypothetical protein
LLEGYAVESYTREDYPITWDGDCKDGKAHGLGRMIASSGAVDAYEIGYVNEGVSKGYYYSGIIGTNSVNFGEYIYKEGKIETTLDNYANTNEKGDVDFIYLRVENDRKTGISKGAGTKKFRDGSNRRIG